MPGTLKMPPEGKSGGSLSMISIVWLVVQPGSVSRRSVLFVQNRALCAGRFRGQEALLDRLCGPRRIKWDRRMLYVRSKFVCPAADAASDKRAKDEQCREFHEPPRAAATA
jgi:hypothetical protein